jgi:two-component system, OmpR family, response regulator
MSEDCDSAGQDVAVERRELKVLLIEDSARLRSRLTSLLNIPGWIRVAATAETEEEANATLDDQRFDVLVVDVELKRGNGIGVIRHAREIQDQSRPPLIVVLTNYALPVVRQRCLGAGADHFLDKMRQFDEVQPLIERWRYGASG